MTKCNHIRCSMKIREEGKWKMREETNDKNNRLKLVTSMADNKPTISMVTLNVNESKNTN